MERLKYLFLVFATASLSVAVKINMKGSIGLGHDVWKTMSFFMHKGPLHNRRSAAFAAVSDKGLEKIKWTINHSGIGKIPIVSGPLGVFIKEYITFLGKAVEDVFEGILAQTDNETKSIIFNDHLKHICINIVEIIKELNKKIKEEKVVFEWVTIVKRISANFQKASIEFVEQRLDGDPSDILNVKKKLIQKLIIAIVIIENKYENRLCLEYEICEKGHLVTAALNNILSDLDATTNQREKDFMKYFYESLPEQLLYFINRETTHELQVILSDLSYSKNTPTKEVLRSVLQAVKARLDFVTDNTQLPKAYDQQLVNMILSDMDYFYYSPRKIYPFDKFYEQFSWWLKDGSKFGTQIKGIMNEMKVKMQDQRPDLIEKLAYQTRVFLELTVDPEK